MIRDESLSFIGESLYMHLMEIRQARLVDVPEMVGMIGELFGIEADFCVDATKQERGLLAILGCEDAAAFVAASGEDLIGMVTIQLTISTAEGGPSGLLEDLYVRKEHRGRGVATALVDAAEAWCSERSAHRVQLLVDLGNECALKFYGVRGYGETRMAARRRYIG
jgi:GNAT superfamily N-acetyltransferase